MGEWPTRCYVDYRFIVEKAEDMSEAADLADELIKEATDNVWYTISKVTRAQQNPNLEHKIWQTASVKWEDPRSNGSETDGK